jgi:23S rRNA pseudouridine1911/1915/1917 synthase
MAVVASGKPATTYYRPIEHHRIWSLLQCRLATGRTHQIRVHLSAIGHPLIGDPLYRSSRISATLNEHAQSFPRQALHAARLSLLHPESGQALSWDSPLPADIAALLARLRGG